MTRSDEPGRRPSVEPVTLRLHRGPAVVYALLAVLLLVFLVLGVRAWLADGKIAAAVVATLVGLAVIAYLVLLTSSIALPELTVSEAGVAGKITWSAAVDVDWSAVTLDVDPTGSTGRLRVGLGDESVVVTPNWLGFGDFVLLIASTPAAVGRLTPAARTEVIRLLGVAGAELTPGRHGEPKPTENQDPPA